MGEGEVLEGALVESGHSAGDFAEVVAFDLVHPHNPLLAAYCVHELLLTLQVNCAILLLIQQRLRPSST